MKRKPAAFLLVIALNFSSLLPAQFTGERPPIEEPPVEKPPVENPFLAFDYVLIERRDQRDEILSHSLRPKISLKKSRTLGIGKIDFHLKSIDYESKNAHVWLDGEEIEAEVKIILSNLVARAPSAPVKVAPGKKPNQYVEKRSKEEVDKAIRSRFAKMDELRRARKKTEAGPDDPPEEESSPREESPSK